jgi:putative ABC transport system permease protein
MQFMLGENAKMALGTLRENKMRSFLTVLGVVIGITSLIAVASILVGLYQDMDKTLSDYGPNTKSARASLFLSPTRWPSANFARR